MEIVNSILGAFVGGILVLVGVYARMYRRIHKLEELLKEGLLIVIRLEAGRGNGARIEWKDEVIAAVYKKREQYEEERLLP